MNFSFDSPEVRMSTQGSVEKSGNYTKISAKILDPLSEMQQMLKNQIKTSTWYVQ